MCCLDELDKLGSFCFDLELFCGCLLMGCHWCFWCLCAFFKLVFHGLCFSPSFWQVGWVGLPIFLAECGCLMFDFEPMLLWFWVFFSLLPVAFCLLSLGFVE